MSGFSYEINNESFNKLSNFKNEGNTYRMKTQYYPKSHLQPFDNKVPGPGACITSDIQTDVTTTRQVLGIKNQFQLLEWQIS